MKVKEISNFYFFRTGSGSMYLLVGTANLPSPPAPVKQRRDPEWKLMHPFDPLPPLEVDGRATALKEDKVRNRFLSKNNVYRVRTGSEQIFARSDFSCLLYTSDAADE